MDTLAVVNCGAVNIHVQVFVRMTVFSGFGRKPGLGSLGHVMTLVNCLRACQSVPRRWYRLTVPPAMHEGSNLRPGQSFGFLPRGGGCDVASRRLDLHSPSDQ